MAAQVQLTATQTKHNQINYERRKIWMLDVKTNNPIFARGAYNWACSEAQHCNFNNDPCFIDLDSTLRTIESGNGLDVKISIFEPVIDPNNSEAILMLEWVEYTKEKINVYPINKKAIES